MTSNTPFSKKTKALLIDFDGTLVDSLPFLKSLYRQILIDYQKKGSDEEFEKLNGRTLSEIAKYLKGQYGLAVEERELLERYKERLSENYLDEIVIYPKAKLFLAQAKRQGFKLALISSCPKKLIESFLKNENITDFDAIYGGEDAAKSKPEPDMFLNALKNLKLDADEALAIEDSFNGITAAHLAKLKVIALHNKENMNHLEGIYYAKNWDEIIGWLAYA